VALALDAATIAGWVERSDVNQCPVRVAMGIASLHRSKSVRSSSGGQSESVPTIKTCARR